MVQLHERVKQFEVSISTYNELGIWPQDHKTVLDFSKKNSKAKTLNIENTKKFNVCLILSPHHFIYMTFQLSIYGK